MLDLSDHAADFGRIRQIGHVADAIKVQRYEGVALNAGTPDVAACPLYAT